jgi:hypothetical protein
VNAVGAKEEIDVGKAKWCVVGGGTRVLARQEKKEEGDHDHIGHSHGTSGSKDSCCQDMVYNLDQEGFYLMGWQVSFGIAPKLTS